MPNFTWNDVQKTERFQTAGIAERKALKEAFFDQIALADPKASLLSDEAKALAKTKFLETPDSTRLPTTSWEDEKAQSIKSRMLRATPVGLVSQVKSDETLKRTGEMATFGAAHTLASALDIATFGLSKNIGLGKEGVEAELKKRGAPDLALGASELAGDIGGYATILPSLLRIGGGTAATFALRKTTGSLVAKAVGWGLAGAERGGLNETINQAFEQAKSENPSFSSALQKIGIASAQEGAAFLVLEAAFGGLRAGGKAFLESKAGSRIIDAAKQLLKVPPKEILERNDLLGSYKIVATNFGDLLYKTSRQPVVIAWAKEVKPVADNVRIELFPSVEAASNQAAQLSVFTRSPKLIEPRDASKLPEAKIFVPSEVEANPNILIDRVNTHVNIPAGDRSFRKAQADKAAKAPKPLPSKRVYNLDDLDFSKIEKTPESKVVAPSSVEAPEMPPAPTTPQTPSPQPTQEGLSTLDLETIQKNILKNKERVRGQVTFKTSNEAAKYGLSISQNKSAIQLIEDRRDSLQTTISALQTSQKQGILSAKGQQQLMDATHELSMFNDVLAVAKDPNPNAAYARVTFETRPTPNNAKEVVSNPDFQDKTIIEKASKVLAETKGTEIIPPKQWLKQLREASHSSGEQHAVRYYSGKKLIANSMSTDEMNLIKDRLSKGETPSDLSGNIITAWIENKPLGLPQGETGLISTDLLLRAPTVPFKLLESLVNLGIDWANESKYVPGLIKPDQLVLPFSIANKHPEFKKIFYPIEDAFAERNLLFAKGWELIEDKMLKQLLPESKEKIAKALWFGNSPAGRTYLSSAERLAQLPEKSKYYTRDELVKMFNLNSQETEAAMKIVEAQQYATAVQKEVWKEKLGFYEEGVAPEEQGKIIKAVDRVVDRLYGYFNNRRSGDWVGLIDDGLSEKPLWYNRFKNENEAKEVLTKVAKELGFDESKIQVYQKAALPKGLVKRLSYDDLVELATEAKKDLSIEAKADVDFALDEMKKVLRETRGEQFFIKRNDIPGFDTNFENLTDSVYNYLESATSRLSMIRAYRGARAGLSEIDRKIDPYLYSFGNQYIEQFFSGGTKSYPWLQKVLYHNGLAFNLSSGLTNMTQSFTMTIPEIAKYFSKGIDAEIAFSKALARTAKYVMYRAKKSTNLDKDLVSALDTLSLMGKLGGKQVRYLLGESEFKRPGAKLMQKAGFIYQEIASAPMKYTEEFNRTVAATAAFDIAKNIMKLEGAEVTKFMSRFIDTTQGVYGTHNIPSVISGAGNVAPFLRSVYTYGSFLQHYLSFLANAHKGGAAKAMRAYLYLAGFSGVSGIPLMNQVAKWFDVNIPLNIRKSLDDHGVSKVMSDVIVRGLPSITGADLSRTVGVGDILPRGSSVTQIARAPGTLVSNMIKLVELMKLGEYRRAAEYLPTNPKGLTNILVAERMAREGITNFKGEQLEGGSPNNLTKKDIALRSIGITPIPLSDVYDLATATKEMEARHSRRTADINERLARAITRKGGKGFAEEIKKIRQENMGKPAYERIMPSQQSVMQRVRALRGKRVATREVYKTGRQEAMRVKKLLGVK